MCECSPCDFLAMKLIDPCSRIVQAVGRLADDVNTSFKSLRNCVVLPSVGELLRQRSSSSTSSLTKLIPGNCSLASQMGGGGTSLGAVLR